MKKHLLTVFNYYNYFSYSPSFDEIYTFFPRKISKKSLKTLIVECVQDKTIQQLPRNSVNNSFRPLRQPFFNLNVEFEFPKYTLPQ